MAIETVSEGMWLDDGGQERLKELGLQDLVLSLLVHEDVPHFVLHSELLSRAAKLSPW